MPDILLLDYDGTIATLTSQPHPRFDQLFLNYQIAEHIKFLNIIAVYGITARALRLIPKHVVELEKWVENSNKFRIKEGRSLRDSSNLLTCRLTENFLTETKLADKFVAVSMRGDKDRACGDEYKYEVKPYEEELLRSKEKHGRFILPEIKNNNNEFFADTSKNNQIDHIIADAEKRFGLDHTFHYFDDAARLCALAAHRILPRHIDFRTYHITKNRITSVPRMVFSVTKSFELVPEHKTEKTQLNYLMQRIAKTYKISARNAFQMEEKIDRFLKDHGITGLSDELILPLIRVKKGCCFFGSTTLEFDENTIASFEDHLEQHLVKTLKEIAEKNSPVNVSYQRLD